MAIPARHVGGAKTGHGFGFHHHILEDLVQGGAEVYGARGIRWSVVQNIGCSASTRLLYTPVEAIPIPFRQHRRLVLRQTGLHGKRGTRQIQRALQIDNFGHSLRAPENIERWRGRQTIISWSSTAGRAAITHRESRDQPSRRFCGSHDDGNAFLTIKMTWYNGLLSKSAFGARASF